MRAALAARLRKLEVTLIALGVIGRRRFSSTSVLAGPVQLCDTGRPDESGANLLLLFLLAGSHLFKGAHEAKG